MSEKSSAKINTPGEELYLVHLSRYHPSPEDFDHDGPTKRERSMSAGEELWELHCRRSNGRASEYEDEDFGATSSSTDSLTKRRTTKQSGGKPVKKASVLQKRKLSLRNREVVVP
jgi:hypothetical protein